MADSRVPAVSMRRPGRQARYFVTHRLRHVLSGCFCNICAKKSVMGPPSRGCLQKQTKIDVQTSPWARAPRRTHFFEQAQRSLATFRIALGLPAGRVGLTEPVAQIVILHVF